jgi:hypothetical protein
VTLARAPTEIGAAVVPGGRAERGRAAVVVVGDSTLEPLEERSYVAFLKRHGAVAPRARRAALPTATFSAPPSRAAAAPSAGARPSSSSATRRLSRSC